MSLEIREVTAADQSLLEQWYAVYARADRDGRSEPHTWQLSEIRAEMELPDPRERAVRVAGLDDGAVMTAGWAFLPLLDNLDLAYVQVFVDPPVRRRGHGTRMLTELERLCRAAGRSVLIGEVAWPYPLGSEGTGWPGAEFARHHGATLALGDVQRRLDLPIGDRRLAELTEAAAAYHRGYRLRRFLGAVPEDLVASYAALDAAVETEAPTGQLALEPAVADPDAVRAVDRQLAAQGRTRVVTMAFHGREPAGFTELIVPAAEPGRAYQWGTLVDRGHRGHRLGMALKVANLRLLQDRWPQVRHLYTDNAESNAHMVTINETLGFEPAGRMGEFQKRL